MKAEIRRENGRATANGNRWWGHYLEGVPGVYICDDYGNIPGRRLRRARVVEQALPESIWEQWGDHIQNASEMLDVDIRTIIACICTESAGHPMAYREEPHLNDASYGLMQTLTRTAYAMGMLLGFPRQVPSDDAKAVSYLLPSKPLPSGGDSWAPFLFNPRNSIWVGTRALRWIDKHFDCEGDPILMAAAYNSGGFYKDDSNPWGLRQFGPHCTTFGGFWTLAAELFV